MKEALAEMLAGGSVKIDTKTFQNDMVTIKSRDDVLTLLVHLGYLAYNGETKSVYIPNEEVREEFLRTTRNSSRQELASLIQESDKLIEATLRMDGGEVAQRIEMAHQYYANAKFYNNEQALRMVIMLAYVSRVDDYCDFQELPGGKGYADILFFPKKKSCNPALLIELKWNHSSGGAIEQIKENGYCNAISGYGGDILLVGINYDEKEKVHTCQIERFEYEVYSYEAFRRKIHDELRIAEMADTDDIKTISFEKYILEIKSGKKNLAMLSEEKICRLQGFTVNEKPTLAGIMLFSDYPQAFFPQLCITAVSVPGTEISMTDDTGERFTDNKRIDGTITQMLDDAIQFVRKNIKVRTIIDPETLKRTDKPEYPMIAVRELIINALVHRDYSIHTDSAPITIRIYSNRLEIENPGGLYGRMTLDQLGKVTADTRNPFIANALEIMGETENRYSGIPTVISAMKKHKLPAPLFENDRGVFRVTLYNGSTDDFYNVEPDEKIILDFCKKPRSRSEIEELFQGRFTIAYVMTKYIHPLVENGRLRLTVPDKPKSKNQRYVTVEI